MDEKSKQGQRFAHLFARVWSDEDFRKRFLSNPLDVLAEYKLDLPPGVKEVRVVENSADVIYLVVPAKPTSVQHLSLSNLPIQILDSPCHGHEKCSDPLCYDPCGCDKGSGRDDEE